MTTQQSTGSKKGLLIGVVGGGVVLLLIAATLFLTDEIGAEYGEPIVTGQPLPFVPPNSSIDGSATGLAAPEVVGQDFNDNEVRIVNDGRAKAIVFLAHWCRFCQAEVPIVQEWLDSGGGVEGIDIYTVATSMDSTRGNFPPSEWLERENWTAPVIRDDKESSVYSAYGGWGFPFWTFVNADGTVELRVSGRMPIEQLEQIMLNLGQ